MIDLYAIWLFLFVAGVIGLGLWWMIIGPIAHRLIRFLSRWM
jgi:hypothetical protein